MSKNNIFNSQNMRYVIGGIVTIIIVAALYKIFNEIFNSKTMQSLSDIAGSAAYLVGSLVNGCSPQTDCNIIVNDLDSCKKHDDCFYDPKTGKCSITSNRSPGTGGFFSTSCALGLGLIIYVSASILLGVITAVGTVFGSYKASNALKQAEILGVGTEKEILKDMKKKAEKIDKDLKDLKKEGVNITEKEAKLTTSNVLNDNLKEMSLEKINSIQDIRQRDIERVANEKLHIETKDKIFEKSKPEERKKAEELTKKIERRIK